MPKTKIVLYLKYPKRGDQKIYFLRTWHYMTYIQLMLLVKAICYTKCKFNHDDTNQKLQESFEYIQLITDSTAAL